MREAALRPMTVPALAVAGSVALHAFAIVALVAGRPGPRQDQPGAVSSLSIPGTAALTIDLHSFPGPKSAGRSAPQASDRMTALAPPGLRATQRGTSSRTVLPADTPPGPILGMPQLPPPDDGAPVVRGGSAAQEEIAPPHSVVRATPRAPQVADPGTSDFPVLPLRRPRSLAAGMPELPHFEPALPVDRASAHHPSSPEPGAFDRSVLPVPAPPAKAAGAPPRDQPSTPDAVTATVEPPEGRLGPGIASTRTIPVDVLPVPAPAPAPSLPAQTAAREETQPALPALELRWRIRAPRPAWRPRPPPVQTATPQPVLHPAPQPVLARPARPRVFDEFANHGLYGDGSTNGAVGSASAAAGTGNSGPGGRMAEGP